LINSARNLYHRTLLMTLYSAALRRAEVCRLKVRDIDSQRMTIRITQGKGRRDRDVPLKGFEFAWACGPPMEMKAHSQAD